MVTAMTYFLKVVLVLWRTLWLLWSYIWSAKRFTYEHCRASEAVSGCTLVLSGSKRWIASCKAFTFVLMWCPDDSEPLWLARSMSNKSGLLTQKTPKKNNLTTRNYWQPFRTQCDEQSGVYMRQSRKNWKLDQGVSNSYNKHWNSDHGGGTTFP